MANCTYSDVKSIVDTDLSDSNITALIVLADREITRRGISGTSDDLKTISIFLTAEMIASRMPMPERSIGENRTLKGPEYYRAMAERAISSVSGIPFVAWNESIE